MKIISTLLIVILLIAVCLLFIRLHKPLEAPTLSIYQYLFKRDGANLDLELLLAANNHSNIKQITVDLSFNPEVITKATVLPLNKGDQNPFFRWDTTLAKQTHLIIKNPTHIMYVITGIQAIHSEDIGKIGTLSLTIKKNQIPTPLPDHSNYMDGFVHSRITANGTITSTTTDGKIFTDKLSGDTFDAFIPYP